MFCPPRFYYARTKAAFEPYFNYISNEYKYNKQIKKQCGRPKAFLRQPAGRYKCSLKSISKYPRRVNKRPHTKSKIHKTASRKTKNPAAFSVGILVPKTGIEPVRILLRRILSPVRLPVPPLRQEALSALSKAMQTLPPVKGNGYNTTLYKKAQQLLHLLHCCFCIITFLPRHTLKSRSRE